MDGYKLWYSGSERRRNGVGILVDEDLRGQVGLEEEVNGFGILVDKDLRGYLVEVKRCLYTAGGLRRFWEDLDTMVRNVPSLEKMAIAGDFNRHIGVLPEGYDDVYGVFGFGVRNSEGAALLDFARAFGMAVVNLSFSKKEDQLITFRSAITKTQIDFLLLRKGDRVLCKECKVILSEHLLTQHRLLVMDLSIKKCKKRRAGKGRPKIK
ncbi:craniofacial development protein 2-like [Capsicum annuum]|uniref:craniofacial development protein 2-like n=1 Tax=Capsicum annuum TaxID=4072 RepID=UPI001FB09226|nr:craniofacial development protein 2-like [Capsicum annuum]